VFIEISLILSLAISSLTIQIFAMDWIFSTLAGRTAFFQNDRYFEQKQAFESRPNVQLARPSCSKTLILQAKAAAGGTMPIARLDSSFRVDFVNEPRTPSNS
jgi:hypothetical protein